MKAADYMYICRVHPKQNLHIQGNLRGNRNTSRRDRIGKGFFEKNQFFGINFRFGT